MLLFVGVASADTLRLALWHEALSRDGPGLLLRDLVKGDAVAEAMAGALRAADADIVVLTKIDFDAAGQALGAFADLVGGYGYRVPLWSNAGIPTGVDLDGDGRSGDPEDAQSYGRFPGEGGLAVLSRRPVIRDGVQSFNDLLWRDLPDAHVLPADRGLEVQRLSSGGHWVVPIAPGGDHSLTLLIGHSNTPVFDGPEDRNGRRNLDELRLWSQILSGIAGPVVFAANTNLDPERGEGYRGAMAEFLLNSGLQDPVPGVPTAHWDRPGPMRVSYLLPSVGLEVVDAKVWPVLPELRHSLITLDIRWPPSAQP